MQHQLSRHVTLGSQPRRADSLWAELTPFPLLPKAKKAQTEKYHLLSSIGLMINETFLRTMNEQKQCPSVLHGHMTIYITPTGPWNFYKLKQLSNVLIRNQRHNPCMSVSHLLESDF